jgi:hypothetical protein
MTQFLFFYSQGINKNLVRCNNDRYDMSGFVGRNTKTIISSELYPINSILKILWRYLY